MPNHRWHQARSCESRQQQTRHPSNQGSTLPSRVRGTRRGPRRSRQSCPRECPPTPSGSERQVASSKLACPVSECIGHRQELEQQVRGWRIFRWKFRRAGRFSPSFGAEGSHRFAAVDSRGNSRYRGDRPRTLSLSRSLEDASGRFRPVAGCGPRTKKGDFECPLVRPLRWTGVTVVSYCLNEAVDGHQYLVAVSSMTCKVRRVNSPPSTTTTKGTSSRRASLSFSSNGRDESSIAVHVRPTSACKARHSSNRYSIRGMNNARLPRPVRLMKFLSIRASSLESKALSSRLTIKIPSVFTTVS